MVTAIPGKESTLVEIIHDGFVQHVEVPNGDIPKLIKELLACEPPNMSSKITRESPAHVSIEARYRINRELLVLSKVSARQLTNDILDKLHHQLKVTLFRLIEKERG